MARIIFFGVFFNLTSFICPYVVRCVRGYDSFSKRRRTCQGKWSSYVTYTILYYTDIDDDANCQDVVLTTFPVPIASLRVSFEIKFSPSLPS